MTTFWLFVTGLIILALVLILPTLFRTARSNVQMNRKDLNVLITREKIADLDEEYQYGSLETQDYEETKKELKRCLIDDVSQEEEGHNSSAKPAWLTTAILLVFVPAMSFLLYQKLGNPTAVNVLAIQENGTANNPNNMEAMLRQLKAKLAQDPTNTEGWMILGRTQMSQNNYAEAEKTFTTLLNLEPQNPEFMLLKADAMAMHSGGSILGEPETLILAALEKDPDNLTGLWLAGMVSREKNDTDTALRYWKKLRALLPTDSADVASVNQLITSVTDTPLLENSQLPEIAAMIEKLKNKLEKEPENPQGWAMLGRSYLIMKRYEDAINALNEADKQNPNTPEIMLALADALAMSNNGKMQGRAEELIERSLAIEPNNIKALWLAGMAAQERNDNTQAIAHWQKLLPLLADDPQSKTEVESLISNAGGTVPQP